MQENLRAGLIRVGCGLEAAGEAGPEAESFESVNDLTNINLITGPEVFPHVTQSESMVWSTPDGQTVVVNYNDSRDSQSSPVNYSGVSVSFDGGNTFQRILPSPFATGHGTNFGDPIVVFNVALGAFYAGDLATGCGGQGVGTWSSPDGMNWSIGACAHTGGSDDRESMWVDNNPASPFYGRMYVSLNDFTQPPTNPIVVTHSDNGTSWSAPVRVNTGAAFIRNIQLTGSPGDDGTVFIGGMDEGGGGVANRINYIFRSLDGGATWTQIQQGPAFVPPGQALCGYFAAIPPIWRHMGWGQPAVGPNGVVHYAYAAHGAAAGDLGDILYVRSDDNGTTWSAPIVLNSDAAAGGTRAQWMPSVSVTPEGQVVVSWYDRRNTTDNSYEFWGIRSADNGLTWDPDERFSDTVIAQPEQPDPAIQACYVGDYNYHSAITGKSWVTWADGRNQVSGHNQQDVYFGMIDQVTIGGTLEGTVSDSIGALVAGARVRAVGPVDRTATANRDGFYRLRLPPGTYDLTVTATDHNPGSATGVVVVVDMTTTQNFTLTGVGILEGTVVDSSGNPIAGAVDEALGLLGTRTTTTDSNGFYRFRLPVGIYQTTVTIFAYETGTANVEVFEGTTNTQNFTLGLLPAHSVSGTIVSSVTLLPVQNAMVRVLGTPIPPAVSDENGMYRFPSVPEGSYDLRASPPASSGLIAKTVSIVVNMDITQDFALDTAQAHTGFELPDYQGSAQGILVTGQQGWYLPNVAGSTDQFVFTYVGNTLNLPANAVGGDQFLGARVPGALARAQLNFDWTAASIWTASYDFAARFNGTLPAVDNLSSFSLQDSTVARYFVALNSWANPAAATMWNAHYQVFTAGGVLVDQSPGPEWQSLAVNHWYRESTTFDFGSNKVVSVSITDLDSGMTATVAPTDWYLAGGTGSTLPLPTALRFFVGGDTVTAGNTMGWDNLVIVSGGPDGAPTRNESRLPETVIPSAPGLTTN